MMDTFLLTSASTMPSNPRWVGRLPGVRARHAPPVHRDVPPIVEGGATAATVPDDPFTQLRAAIEAVFASWNSPRAMPYRKHHGLDERGGTAVVVQAMVFGDCGATLAPEYCSPRDPITGADEPFGEWLPSGRATTSSQAMSTANRSAPCGMSNPPTTTS